VVRGLQPPGRQRRVGADPDWVAKSPEGLDRPDLLEIIEAGMKDATERLQRAMSYCLTQIGIEHAEHRARAVAIGEFLEVLKGYRLPLTTPPRMSRSGSLKW
jgi:3-methyladenine DNA glycosylase AlkD